FECAAERLTVNARVAPGGYARVKVEQADGTPLAGVPEASALLAGDSTRHEVTWPGGSVSRLQGQRIRLRFELRAAELFSFSC
ncbi:MAG TPA: hypothetical protein VFN74_06860, partial [Chloroflexota bacterium]|nr:hypothetical protein [Chloroflexota bacterium]